MKCNKCGAAQSGCDCWDIPDITSVSLACKQQWLNAAILINNYSLSPRHEEMWSDSFKAGNTIYRSQDTYSNFTLCDHIWLFVGKVHVAARDSVQSHLLQEWLCAHAYVIMAGSYGISTLHGITKLSAVQYHEEFYLILFPNTSLQDNLLHLTLLNQCFRQQSTSEMCGVHEKSGCCRGAPQILCTNSTQFLYTHTQKP